MEVSLRTDTPVTDASTRRMCEQVFQVLQATDVRYN